ncbi:MAG TPA: alpha/beta hydrolase domain-containing protein [Bryobacteraceae bacterium]|nr:alpha/beta hydrolase domain-containing protein [Bryobacteraceae bacterium]
MTRRPCCLLLPLLSCVSFAAVTRVDVTERSDVLQGASFGSAGPYERIAGKVHFAVDPKLAPNRIIADIDLAPRNSEGKVEFSSEFYILRPRDPARSNGTMLLEISNRGGKGLLGTFDLASGSSDPRTPPEFGDNFLVEQGFTLVWVGWEFDVPPGPKLMHLYAPVATNNGRAITGLVRSEWEGDKRVNTISLGDRNQVGYPVADETAQENRMFVRDTAAGERRMIARDNWKFSDATHVTLEGGFDPGKIYEVIYLAKDPVVAGLGPAAVRDMASYLKYGGADTVLAGEQKTIQRALAFGVSQSGRFLRTFLYDGFNQDEKNRRVFDGVWAHIAGAGRGSFNVRFAQPSRDGHPFLNVLYPVDLPPFTDNDGVLAKAGQAHVVPKIFYSNGSYEYWGRSASLIHTTPDGKQDAPIAKDTRIYFFAGSQHGNGSLPPRSVEAQNQASVNDYRASMRALLVAMQAWLKDGKEPPASEYPRIGKDQLVAASALAFPRVPGVHVPQIKREAYRLDFSVEPPKMGAAFPTLVPQVDLDGNETSGIKMPEVQAPLASNTGWNLRSRTIGAPDELYSMVGSWIPFPLNQAEREKRDDPRQSIEERYKNKRDYLQRITLAAQKLVQSGFLLGQDVDKLRDRAAKEWDYVLRSN